MKENIKHTQRAGGVVINNQGQVLVVNQHGRAWSLPKGGVDAGESLEEAAKREIYEESGIKDLTMVRYLGNYDRFKMNIDGGDDNSEFRTIHLFLFRTNQTALSPVDPENPEAKWLNKDDIAALLTHRKDKDFFEKIMERKEL